jgi:hypothetical protein
MSLAAIMWPRRRAHLDGSTILPFSTDGSYILFKYPHMHAFLQEGNCQDEACDPTARNKHTDGSHCIQELQVITTFRSANIHMLSYC